MIIYILIAVGGERRSALRTAIVSTMTDRPKVKGEENPWKPARNQLEIYNHD